MKTLWLMILSAATWSAWKKREEAKKKAAEWEEEVPVNGTDWAGDMWQRLDGADLLSPKPCQRNLAASTIADPGKVGMAKLGLQPDWQGNIA